MKAGSQKDFNETYRKFIKSYKEFSKFHTESYPPPKYVIEPAPGDKGFALVKSALDENANSIHIDVKNISYCPIHKLYIVRVWEYDDETYNCTKIYMGNSTFSEASIIDQTVYRDGGSAEYKLQYGEQIICYNVYAKRRNKVDTLDGHPLSLVNMNVKHIICKKLNLTF